MKKRLREKLAKSVPDYRRPSRTFQQKGRVREDIHACVARRCATARAVAPTLFGARLLEAVQTQARRRRDRIARHVAVRFERLPAQQVADVRVGAGARVVWPSAQPCRRSSTAACPARAGRGAGGSSVAVARSVGLVERGTRPSRRCARGTSPASACRRAATLTPVDLDLEHQRAVAAEGPAVGPARRLVRGPSARLRSARCRAACYRRCRTCDRRPPPGSGCRSRPWCCC